MCRTLPFVLLFCLSLSARAGEFQGLPLWTEDGRFFVYFSDERSYVSDEEGNASIYGEVFLLAHVHEISSGKTEVYLLERSTLHEGELIVAWERTGAKSREAFAEWSRSQRLVPGHFSRSARGMTVEALWREGSAEEGFKPGIGEWKGDAFNIQVGWDGVLDLAVLRGQTRLAPRKEKVGERTPQSQMRLRVNWSPDGRHLAYVLEWPEMLWMLGPAQGSIEVFVHRLAPRVQLTAHQSLASKVVARAGAALEKAGFASSVGPKALKARPSSVVYAAPELLEEAARLAKALPGGASVEPLTWKVDAEIVVALGESAAR